MKKVLLILTILLSSLFINVYAYETIEYGVYKADTSEKVYDYADILNNKQEEQLYEKLTNFIKEYERDFIIVTIDKNPEEPFKGQNSSTVYADDFYDYNHFGLGDNHSGMILLIDMDNRMFVMTTAGSSIEELPYNFLEDVYNYMDYPMGRSEYYEACDIAIKKIENYYQEQREIIQQEIDVEQKVYDYSNTLTSNELKELRNIANNFKDKFNMEYIMVIGDISDPMLNDNNPSLFYTYHNFNQNGVLVIYNTNYKHLEIKYMGNATNRFDKHFKNRIKKLYNYDDTTYEKMEIIGNAITEYKTSEAKFNIKSAFCQYGIILFIISSIIALIYGLTRKHKYIVELKIDANYYLKHVQLENTSDTYVNTHLSRIYSPVTTSSGGSGFSSGGGSHISHSGSSHGGGGGHHF